ncbi:MAG: hypothetical protein H6Q76_966 [Firmicutes bacterium]|nr:hypothetical protein [Bacillota bacterium]
MTVYVALLRGVNVGGKNMVKMADIKSLFEEIGLSSVRTYIQSGNVLFKSDRKPEILRSVLEHEFESAFGFSVVVILRTSVELKQIIRDCPFSAQDIAEAAIASEAESLYVALMPNSPLKENVERLNPYMSKSDQVQIDEQNVYLLLHHGIRNSKLATNLHKLDVPMTVRNWKTVTKLSELANAMENGK